MPARRCSSCGRGRYSWIGAFHDLSLAFAGDLIFLGTSESGLIIELRQPDGTIATKRQLFTRYPKTRDSVSSIQVDGQLVIVVVDGQMKVSFDRGDTWASVRGEPFPDTPAPSDGITEGITFLHYHPSDRRVYFVFGGRFYRAGLPAREALARP